MNTDTSRPAPGQRHYMANTAPRPVLFRTKFVTAIPKALYILDCAGKHIAELELVVPRNCTTTRKLRLWELELEAHINNCWDISRQNPKTIVDLLCSTLNQIPGFENAPKPRIGETTVPVTWLHGHRTVLQQPIPLLRGGFAYYCDDGNIAQLIGPRTVRPGTET